MGSDWSNRIDANLAAIHADLAMIAEKLNKIPMGKLAGADKKDLSEEDIQVGGSYTLKELKSAGFEDIKSFTQDLVEATYAIKTATIAMRGYTMLIGQAGLSKDQKAMIRELEYAMMATMKAAQAIMLLMKSQAIAELMSGPLTWKGAMDLAIIGGYSASSLAYSSKIVGGRV
jgi:hypothetical protein